MVAQRPRDKELSMNLPSYCVILRRVPATTCVSLSKSAVYISLTTYRATLLLLPQATSSAAAQQDRRTNQPPAASHHGLAGLSVPIIGSSLIITQTPVPAAESVSSCPNSAVERPENDPGCSECSQKMRNTLLSSEIWMY